jgi:glycosyltransferase involved in cell wall biosynthesis
MIKACIDSVRVQDYKNWEHIIVDDGSTDDLDLVLKNYKEDNRIKYFKKNNTGAADSRNFGAKHATGAWIIFLDSDDFVKVSWLNIFLNESVEDVSVITCGYERVNENLELIEKRNYLNGNELQRSFGVFLSGTYLIRKELFLKIGGFDKSLKSGHHTELLFRLIQDSDLNTKLVFKNLLSEAIIIVNHHGLKIRSSWYAKLHGSYDILKKHFNFLSTSDYNLLIGYYTVIARASYELKKRQLAIHFGIESIKLKPLSIKNWIRLLRYLLNRW